MATLPTYARVLLQGRTDTADYGVLRTDMDGLAKQRPRWTKPIIRRSAQIMVRSRADKTAFDEWVALDLYGGSGWFDYVDPWRPSTPMRARFVGGALEWMSQDAGVFIATCEIESIGP